MYISKEVRDLLCNKLNFNDGHISVINDSMTLSAKILGYVQIIQSDMIDRKDKLEAVNSLQKLRGTLEGMQSPTSSLLSQAYEEFYSFRRFKTRAA